MDGTSFLTAADIADIRQLRADAFATGRAVADPQTDLTLNRAGTEIAAQAVLIDWVNRRDSRQVGGAQAMRETQVDVIFRRPDPFDVLKGDRFRVQANTGVITRVYRDRGLTFAEATLDVGNV